MVEGWVGFLDEFDSIRAGKTLVAFWRGQDAQSEINVRRVVNEPRTLDLILRVQGNAAAPYLEKGEVSATETWARINQIFGGEFIWFN